MAQRSKQKLLLKDKNGYSTFNGQCWPGNSVYLDFMNSEGRTFWADLYNNEWLLGLDKSQMKRIHAWLDMNEPSVF